MLPGTCSRARPGCPDLRCDHGEPASSSSPYYLLLVLTERPRQHLYLVLAKKESKPPPLHNTGQIERTVLSRSLPAIPDVAILLLQAQPLRAPEISSIIFFICSCSPACIVRSSVPPLTLISDSWVICLRICSLHFIFACLRLFDQEIRHPQGPRNQEAREKPTPDKNIWPLNLNLAGFFAAPQLSVRHGWAITRLPLVPHPPPLALTSLTLPSSTHPGHPSTGADISPIWFTKEECGAARTGQKPSRLVVTARQTTTSSI